jgi:hypothetical protein
MLKRILRAILLAPVALFLLFEEWCWEPLAAGFSALSRWSWWAQLEPRIARLSPRASLLVFGVPVLALQPIKRLAFYLFAKGQVVVGPGQLLTEKLAGTALTAVYFN